MIGEENEKIYGFFKIIAITITYIIIGFITIFFIATSKVEALQLSYDNLPQDGKPYYVGTRSGGQITERTVSYVTNSSYVPPFEIGNINIGSANSTKYWSVSLTHTTRVNRVYMITMYYYGDDDNTQFTELTGVCTGDLSTCARGQQTINYTRLYFQTGGQLINIVNPHINNANSTTQVTQENDKAKKIQMIFISNNNGAVISMYLNSNNDFNRLYIYSVGVEDLGLSENFFNSLNQDNKNYMDIKTQAIIDWVTGKSNDLQTQIDNLKALENNHYTWLTGQITNARTEIDNAKNSINNNITQATNSTNQAINNQTQDITNNQNQNTQDTINNQNNNAWQCSTQVQDLIDMPLGISKRYLNSNGQLVNSNGYDVTDYVKVQGTFKIIFHDELSNDNQLSLCLYNENYQKTRCERYTPNVSGTLKEHQTIVQEGEVYAKFSFDRQASVYNEYYSGTYCVNRENNNSTIINNNINNINNNLTDSNVDNPTGAINGLNNQIVTNGVISDLLLLPVSLFQKLLNSVNGTCTTFNLGTLFGHQLTMPCINISSFLGQAIYSSIDIMISGFFILRMRKKFVDIFNNITSLKTGGNELE